MKNGTPLHLNGRGQFISDPEIKISIGVITVDHKRRVAWSLHDNSFPHPRIFPLTRKEALMISETLTRVALMVDE